MRVVETFSEVETLVRLGHARTALERAQLAMEAATQLNPSMRAAALHARARARDALGDLDGAEADVLVAAELDPNVAGRWLFGAQIAASREDFGTARHRYRRAIAVAEAVGGSEVVPQARWELAHLESASGDPRAARRELEAAVAMAQELGDVASAAYCELALADMDAAENPGHARERYAHVRALSELLPEPGAQHVFAEPGSPSVTEPPAEVLERPAPPDPEPVLRVVLSPSLGEQAGVELWPGAGASPRRVIVPFRFAVSPRTQERLRWYTEDYTARPLDPSPAIAAEVEQELEQLGETLFAQVLGQEEAAALADSVRQSLGSVRVEIVADAISADAIPWELLRDPVTSVDIALSARTITRTTTVALTAAAAGRHSGTMRILLAIARPEGRLDVGFRSVADPLLRELTASGAPVIIDVLRPPTLERLRAVLGAARTAGRPYDLFHFDGHGGFTDGRGGLVFESGDEIGALVSGDEIGRALQAGDVPLLVMNACRSAAGEAYGSIAREALEEGLAAVVAMRFNVYVPTAALFMGRLYGALGAGGDLSTAVTQARCRLAERLERSGLPVVRDWCVPALYQAASVRLASGSARVERSGDAYASALPPPPSHGFVGRDEVFVELETALAASPHVILRAFAGAGKTTAAIEFARWYARTGGGELELWDDVLTFDDTDRDRLATTEASGGRVLLITDRLDAIGDLPLVPMPNLPGDEAYALAMAVAANAGATVTPEAGVELANALRGHALAIELAVRELARRGPQVDVVDVAPIVGALQEPTNGSPEPWARTLGEALELEGVIEPAVLAAQFRGYISVLGFGALRDGGHDFEAAATVLDELAARGVLTRVNPAIYAIHPGLPVALATAGRFETAGRAFVEAIAETAAAWGDLAETEGAIAPWAAEAENLTAARELASRGRWWPLVVRLLGGVNALGVHGGMPEIWRTEVLEAAPDFVDVASGEPLPGMEAFGPVFLGHLASIAGMEGDTARMLRLRRADVRYRRDAAAAAVGVAKDRRTSDQNKLVRRLAVGLTNLGPAQSEANDPDALETLTEAAALANELDDWRLEAQNRLNLGVYWMTVPSAPEFERADAEFAAGYKLSIAGDAPLAGELMTERGTVYYERGIRSEDPAAAQRHFEQAANHLQLAVGLREPDAVLFHQLGQVYRHLGDYESARAYFEQAIELREAERSPGAGADARLHLAHALEEAGLLAEALSYAHSAEAVMAGVDEPDPGFQLAVEQTVARLALRVRAGAR